MNKTLDDFMDEVYRVNKANGWYDQERTFGDGIALIHSEVSEALEAYRKNTGTVGEELADVFIRLLDMCHRLDVDLYSEYEKKMEINKKRGYRHGGLKL